MFGMVGGWMDAGGDLIAERHALLIEQNLTINVKKVRIGLSSTNA